MKKIIYSIYFLCFIAFEAEAQSGNHVFSGGEATNFGIIDLATPGAQTWSTDRSVVPLVPGYFSSVGAAPYINGSDAANVNGHIKHYADASNQTYDFPVGTGTDLRNLTITGTIPSTTTVGTAWIVGDPTIVLDNTDNATHNVNLVGSGINRVSTVGQWDWQDFNNNASGATIVVSIPDVSFFSLTSNLRLVGWNGSQWVNLSVTQGSSAASGNTENSTLTGTMQSNITAIGIGTIVTPLPLELLAFNVSPQACEVIINWETANEINLSSFIVEQSTDGNHFNQIHTVTAKNSVGRHQYNFRSIQKAQLSYYRIKMIDLDGSFRFSEIKMVRTACNDNAMVIYPNPANGSQVTISIYRPAEEVASLELYNELGQRVRQKYEILHKGINSIYVNVNGFQSGTYMVQLMDKNGNLMSASNKLLIIK